MKRPHTYFSTEFHGGPRAVRARLGNLFAAPRRSGRLLPVSYTHLDVYKRQQ